MNRPGADGEDMDSEEAKVSRLAIALQESHLEYRRHIDSAGNPIHTLARELEFQAGGGVKGVMTHPASLSYAGNVCLGCTCRLSRTT